MLCGANDVRFEQDAIDFLLQDLVSVSWRRPCGNASATVTSYVPKLLASRTVGMRSKSVERTMLGNGGRRSEDSAYDSGCLKLFRPV